MEEVVVRGPHRTVLVQHRRRKEKIATGFERLKILPTIVVMVVVHSVNPYRSEFVRFLLLVTLSPTGYRLSTPIDACLRGHWGDLVDFFHLVFFGVVINTGLKESRSTFKRSIARGGAPF